MIQEKTPHIPFKKGSLLFAPMEGVTDLPFRLSIMELYPEWDYLSTDFLRLPSNGKFSLKKFIEHIGEPVLNDALKLEKTSFQILGNSNVDYHHNVKIIRDLNIPHLDLNLGCPSPKVNKHKGGAYLLSDLERLRVILETIRENYPHHFSAKIRLGFNDTENFDEIIEVLEECGVDSITIHGRTRLQLYKGVADWSFIKKAVSLAKVPVVGNGDVFDIQSIEDAFASGCHSIMLGRGALTTPWLPGLFKEHLEGSTFNEVYLQQIRKDHLKDLIFKLTDKYIHYQKSEGFILGRLKQLVRYLIVDFDQSKDLSSQLLRTSDLDQFLNIIEQI